MVHGPVPVRDPMVGDLCFMGNVNYDEELHYGYELYLQLESVGRVDNDEERRWLEDCYVIWNTTQPNCFVCVCICILFFFVTGLSWLLTYGEW